MEDTYKGIKLLLLNEDDYDIKVQVLNRDYNSRQVKKLEHKLNLLALEGNVCHFTESSWCGRHLISHYCSYGMAVPMGEMDKLFNNYRSDTSIVKRLRKHKGR